MAYILETQNLTKIYGHKEAVKDVNLHIREGQIYGLIGRNGAARQPDGSLRLNGGLDQTKEISKAIVGAGIGLEEIYLRTMTLEEYYLGMTGGEHNG